MKKVTIEISPNGWITTVTGENVEIKRQYIKTSTGARCVDGSFEDDPLIPDELCEALDDGQPFDIMLALKKINS